MSGTIINFEERRRNAQIKKTPNVCDLRAKFHDRSIHRDSPSVEKKPVSFTRAEFRTMLTEINAALGSGIIRDYAAPMSTSAQPIFALKTRTQDPDLISLEKALADEDTIYIVRKHGKTPEIKRSFEGALEIIRDELNHKRNQNQIHLVSDHSQPDGP